MTDRLDFEARLAHRLAAHTTGVVRPFDASAISASVAAKAPPTGIRQLIASHPHRRGLQLLLLAVVVVSIVGGALLVGSQLMRRAQDQLTTRSPSGLILVASVVNDQTGDLRVMGPEGQPVLSLTPMLATLAFEHRCPRFVAGGARVAYWVNVGEGDFLTIAPLDGSRRMILPTIPARRLDSWDISPDGSHLAYLSGEPDRPDLSILSLEDGSSTVAAHGMESARSVVWNPDGRQLAIGIVSDSETGIDLMDASGANRHAVIRGPLDRESTFVLTPSLFWSPDGRYLAYHLSPHAESWILDVATGESTLVARFPEGGAGYLPWDPSGHAVMYFDGTNVATFDIVSGARHTMADTNHWPKWSPVGERLAFLIDGDRPGHMRLGTVQGDLSGRVEQPLASPATNLAWSPDGSWIAVQAADGLSIYDPGGVIPAKRISDVGVSSPTSCVQWSDATVAHIPTEP